MKLLHSEEPKIRNMNTPSRPATDHTIGSGAGDFGIENRSRSGRVRKKNTLLAEYESLEDLEKGKIGRRKSDRRDSNSSAKATLKFADLDEPVKTSASLKRKPPPKKEGESKRVKLSGRKNDFSKKKNKLVQRTPPRLDQIYMGGHEEGDLQMDLPPEFQDDNDMPILGGEEIIDGTLLDEEEAGRDVFEHLNSSKLKSQAQSTYMMEKTMEKNKKSGSSGSGTPGKAKAVRKDKGTPRVTAYMLWAKDQRAMLAKKNPSLDFALMNKKLSDLWGTVPQNQKKMWKNKALKIMKKNSNIMDNIKNSGPLPPPPGKGKKPRGRPRLHMLADQDLSNGDDDIIMPVKKSSPPLKAVPRKPGGNFLLQSEKTNAKKLPVNSTKKSPALAKHFRQENSVSKPTRNFKGVTNGVKVSNPRNHVAPKAKKYTVSPPSTSYSSSKKVSSRKEEDFSSILKTPSTTPLDVAAHFALLGESLSVIGQRLKDVEGQTVSGSLSVLLDSLLCAAGPLLCLCQQVPELNCIPPEQLSRLLDNIAYVMPGL